MLGLYMNIQKTLCYKGHTTLGTAWVLYIFKSVGFWILASFRRTVSRALIALSISRRNSPVAICGHCKIISVVDGAFANNAAVDVRMLLLLHHAQLQVGGTCVRDGSSRRAQKREPGRICIWKCVVSFSMVAQIF